MTTAQARTIAWRLRIPETYALSRARFLAAAARRDLPVTSYVNAQALGIEGEELACDVVHVGRADADKVLVVSSGIHGVEGYCGSAIQCAILADDDLLRDCRDIRLALVHGLNPHGFSHYRRVNEDNVDVNRNFRDFDTPLPANPDYDRAHAAIFPDQWRGADLDQILGAVNDVRAALGERTLQDILTRGQYHFAADPFFGGEGPVWSHRTWSAICAAIAGPGRTVCYVDIHTGLGEAGACEIIFASDPATRKIALAKSWFGADRVKVPGAGESLSSNISGFLGLHMAAYCKNEVSIAMEFGTVPLWEMIEAVIADNWLAANAPVDTARATAIHGAMKRAFFSQEPAWLEQVGQEARNILLRAIGGLTRA